MGAVTNWWVKFEESVIRWQGFNSGRCPNSSIFLNLDLGACFHVFAGNRCDLRLMVIEPTNHYPVSKNAQAPFRVWNLVFELPISLWFFPFVDLHWIYTSISLSKTVTCLGSCFLASKAVAKNHSIPPNCRNSAAIKSHWNWGYHPFSDPQMVMSHLGSVCARQPWMSCVVWRPSILSSLQPGEKIWDAQWMSWPHLDSETTASHGRISPKRGFQHRKAWRYGRNAGELMGICECRGPCPLYTLRWFKDGLRMV